MGQKPDIPAFLLVAACFWPSPPLAAEQAAIVAAATNLQSALPELAKTFGEKSGLRIRVSFGSSGNFYHQIRQGAPFELFFSADETYVTKLAEAGFTLGKGAVYGAGRIVLFAPHGSPLKPDGELKALATALAAGRVQRFAIPNPEHAPYGRAAREALKRAGLWAVIKPHLVLGENASQTAQFAVSGSTAGGIIPYSLALAPAMDCAGRYVLIPASRHRPLTQRMVLLKRADETARRFFDFVLSQTGREILRRHGFALPGEDV